MRKKAFLVVVVVIIIGAIMILPFFCYNKSKFIEKKFDLVLPKNACICILEIHPAFNTIDEHTIAAKIVMSKDDYNEFVSNISNKYLKFNPAHYKNENFEGFVLPESDTGFNLERFDEDLSWWDLDTSQITYVFYCQSQNPRLGVRRLHVKKIYVSEQCDQITLYLYNSM